MSKGFGGGLGGLGGMIGSAMGPMGRDFGTQAAAPMPGGGARGGAYTGPPAGNGAQNQARVMMPGETIDSVRADAMRGMKPERIAQMQQLQQMFDQSMGGTAFARPPAAVAPPVVPVQPPAATPVQTRPPGTHNDMIKPPGMGAKAPGPAQTVAGTGGTGMTPQMQQILAAMMPQGVNLQSLGIRPLMARGA